MSAFRPMTTDDLLELAPLDALGLLDKNDAAMFERTFLSATPEIQARVREIQASYATDSILMSEDEPPIELEAHVVSGVMSEIRRSTEELAPLAIIGPGSATRQLARRRERGFGSAMLWRAASFVLLAGVVTAITFYNRTVDSYDRLAGEMYANELSQSIHRELGPSYFDLVDSAAFRYPLASPRGNPVFGGVAVNTNRNTAVIYAVGLATTGVEYRVEVIDPSTQKVIASERFDASGSLTAARIRFSPTDSTTFASATYRVVDDKNNVVLTSAITVTA